MLFGFGINTTIDAELGVIACGGATLIGRAMRLAGIVLIWASTHSVRASATLVIGSLVGSSTLPSLVFRLYARATTVCSTCTCERPACHARYAPAALLPMPESSLHL